MREAEGRGRVGEAEEVSVSQIYCQFVLSEPTLSTNRLKIGTETDIVELLVKNLGTESDIVELSVKM